MARDAESLRELLVDLFRRGDALSGFVAEHGWLSAWVGEEVGARGADLGELAGAVAEAVVSRGEERALRRALALRFPGRLSELDAALGGGEGWWLRGGALVPIAAARGLALLLVVGAAGLPWLATWQGVLERPALARLERPPEEVQYRPELVWVPGGRFVMGSSAEERARFGEGLSEEERKAMEDETQHEMEVGALYVGRTEVTLGQWEAVMGTRPNDCDFGCKDDHPVQRVTWHDACAYANRLTELENELRQRRGEAALSLCYVAEGSSWAWPAERRGCTGYRLPTEAEWEYVARADTQTAYSFGEDIEDLCAYANVADESAKKKHPDWEIAPCDDGYADLAPVGKFKANGWGLFDMHGNVYEWLWDWYGEYPSKVGGTDKGRAGDDKDDKSVKSEPYTGPESGEYRVLRGGSFWSVPGRVRAAVRVRYQPTDQFQGNGFRVLRVSPES